MKTVYLYNPETNEFSGAHECQLNTINNDDYDVPWNSLPVSTPKLKKNEVAVANQDTQVWEVQPDFRGTVYYTKDREKHEIEEIGKTVPSGSSNEEPPSEYHSLVDSKWVLDDVAKAKQLRDSIARAESEIDDEVANVYARFQRFEMEYKLRESEAQAFKTAGYKGKMPQQVAAYAKPAGLTAKAACDDILASANQLRGALAQLGVLRMRKVALRKLTSIKTVENHLKKVMEDVAKIAGAL